MSTDADRCALCSSHALEAVIDLPALPLTDTLCADPGAPRPPDHDQRLNLCRACGHLQLGTWLPGDLLYGHAYRYRTSGSILGKREIDFFIKSLEGNSNKRHYRCILEIGCNDLQLLGRLRPVADDLVGVDPVLADPTIEVPRGVRAIPAMLEDAALDGALPTAPDLIICRHTLEHLTDPAGAIVRFLDLLAPDGMALVESPCVDALLQRGRFDQIFHQHLHYFGRARLKAAIESLGGRIEWEALSWHDWGVYILAFSKGGTSPARGSGSGPLATAPEIRARYGEFRGFMASIAAHLDRLRRSGPVYGFGAAQLLPVLAWHLGTDFEWLSAVLDSDRAKHGLTYANLPVTVEYPETESVWQDATVVITAVDHAPALLARLSATRPKQIVLPLMTI